MDSLGNTALVAKCLYGERGGGGCYQDVRLFNSESYFASVISKQRILPLTEFAYGSSPSPTYLLCSKDEGSVGALCCK